MDLRRQVLKGKIPGRGGQRESATHRSQIYNQNESECRWPYDVFGNVADCEFKYEVLHKDGEFWVVKMPKDTPLYHSTQLLGGKGWWDTNYPFDSSTGGVWFTSNFRHSRNFTTKTHTLVYPLKQDLVLVFVWNLSKTFGEGVRGYEFVSRFYAPIKEKLKTQGIDVSGYLSCNECEVFIENDAIPNVLDKGPAILAQRSSAYID